MKQLAATILLLVSLASLTGCKKFVEKKKEDALVKAMVDGQWAITSFVHNGNNITPDFTGYKFQYYEDKTVDAIKDGSVETTGDWDGDVNTMTTWASFTGVSTPLSHINGSWHIDDSGWTYVVATQATTSDTKVMRLDKQ
jgi:competence protein ComGC